MKTIDFFNIRIQATTQQKLLKDLQKGVLITPNVDHLVKLQKDKEFYDVYQKAEWVVCDSKILYLMSKLLKESLPEAIPGSSFFTAYYMYHKDDPNCKIFLLGAAEGIAEKAKRNINEKVGREIVVGAHSPSYGFEKNEAYKNVFNARVHELGLTDNIYYIPRVEQKYLSHVYANTDIFLLPTIYDIYGMVLLESMYFGMPTVTSINGGSDMMMEDGINGFVIPKFEAKVWAEKVIELSNDKEFCKKIGDAAHKTIVEKFTWDKLASQFINIYEQKLKEG